MRKLIIMSIIFVILGILLSKVVAPQFHQQIMSSINRLTSPEAIRGLLNKILDLAISIGQKLFSGLRDYI